MTRIRSVFSNLYIPKKTNMKIKPKFEECRIVDPFRFEVCKSEPILLFGLNYFC